MNTYTHHEYRVGDTVLVQMNDAPIPGVIDTINGEQLQVRLAEPWVQETGEPRTIVVVSRAEVSPSIDENAPLELSDDAETRA
jgi:hypothetical protein